MGGRRITDKTIRKVRWLLAQDLSNHEIARRVEGISVTGVRRIKVKQHRPGPKPKTPHARELRVEKADECPGCKQKIIVKPCVICAAWKRKGTMK